MDREATRNQETPVSESTLSQFSETPTFIDTEHFSLKSFPLGAHADSNQNRLREIMGEFELVRATLDDAINTYRRYAFAKGRRAQRLFREVDEWLSADDRSWPFSFVNICDILDLDPDYIRTGLRLWRERSHDARQSAA